MATTLLHCGADLGGSCASDLVGVSVCEWVGAVDVDTSIDNGCLLSGWVWCLQWSAGALAHVTVCIWRGLGWELIYCERARMG